MRASIIAAAAALSLCAGYPAIAQETPEAEAEKTDAPAEPIEVIRNSDAALTCVQISDEAAQLSESMGGEPGTSVFSRLGGVAKAGAALLIPGAGLATAAADAMTQPGRDRREAAELSVQHRWYYLNGLYAGHGCQAQAEAALAPAAPTVAAAPAPTAAVTPATAPTAPALTAASASAQTTTTTAVAPSITTSPR